MILVKNMFSTGKLSAAQQQAAIQIVSNSQEMLGNQSLVILGEFSVSCCTWFSGHYCTVSDCF